MLSKVKATPLTEQQFSIVQAFILKIENEISKWKSENRPQIKIKEIEGQEHWFQNNVSEEITFLLNEISKQTDNDIQNFLKIVLSSIIVRVSNQDSDTRFAAIEKNVINGYTLGAFKKKTRTLRKAIEIGEKEFASKKEALNHYKAILNSYDFGETLKSNDFYDILDLLETHPNVIEKIGCGIDKVRVAKLKYDTKSFELVRIDGSTEYFSYTKRINAPKTDFSRFREACRQAIQEDLRNVKLSYFDKYSKKGKVKCQETGELLKYDELNVDHRQPNTFSVIVDRFVELKNIDFKNIDYLTIDGGPNELADKKLKEDFRQYHKDKANLRIVKKTLNLERSFQARVNRQKKDLKI